MRSKYGNVPVTYFGIKFDSTKEGNRYLTLRSMQEEHSIRDLHLQTVFSLDVNGIHICNYKADFSYRTPDGEYVVEDTKGKRLPLYLLKKKLMLAIHGIKILES